MRNHFRADLNHRTTAYSSRMNHSMILKRPGRVLAGLAFLLALFATPTGAAAQSSDGGDSRQSISGSETPSESQAETRSGSGSGTEGGSTLDKLRALTPEQKARLRSQYEKRSFLRHFTKMDRNNDGALTRDEMLTYFTIIHTVFDADYNDVVSVVEAPALLLRIKLMGKAFPEEGLTLPELQARLDETFTFLDKNQNGKLGWPELL